jgi:hypothetical protein
MGIDVGLATARTAPGLPCPVQCLYHRASFSLEGIKGAIDLDNEVLGYVQDVGEA